VRLTQLDGLRGLAALVVVVHHIFLLDATLADPTRTPAVVPRRVRLGSSNRPKASKDAYRRR
jgi:peptidoglycan/LPS O-acetylase OafA/YrhL